MAMYTERKRHHRVGKREADHAPHRSYCIKKDHKNLIIAGLIIFGTIAFVKGLIIGMYVMNSHTTS